MRIILLGGLIFSLLAAPGCSLHPVETCGWIGGTFGTWSIPISGTPGAFVHRLSDDTPAFRGGIREGDLITSIDNTPVTGATDFYTRISSSQPGSVLAMHLYRYGENIDVQVVAGRETFQKRLRSNVRIGLDFDPIPNPSFNVLNLLGFFWHNQRVELADPYWKYYRYQVQSGRGAEGIDAPNEWRVTLGLVNVCGYRHIVKQESVSRLSAPQVAILE